MLPIAKKRIRLSKKHVPQFFLALLLALGQVAASVSTQPREGQNDGLRVLDVCTCFTRGTLIRVHPQTNGAILRGTSYYKAIETIAVGDLAYSWNEKTGQVSYNRVTELFVNPAQVLFKTTYENGDVIHSSWNHPFLIDGKGWVEAKDLARDMQSHHSQSIQNLTLAQVSQPSTPAFTGARLIMAGYGGMQTEKHSARMQRGPPGAAPLPIASVEQIPLKETISVYNFEVENDHTYFVGQSEVLVHNYEKQLEGVVKGLYKPGLHNCIARDSAGTHAECSQAVQNTITGVQWALSNPSDIPGAIIDGLIQRGRALLGMDGPVAQGEAIFDTAMDGAYTAVGGASVRGGTVVSAGARRGIAPPVRAARLPHDVAVHRTAPPPLPLNRPIGLSPTQNAQLQRDITAIRSKGATDIRVNQEQVTAGGDRVGRNRPDLQYTLSGKRFYIEYDTSRSQRGLGHQQRILANDPSGTVILKTVD